MTIDLTECRAKIERAQKHRDELNAVVGPVLNWEAELFQMYAKLERESGYHVFRLAAMPKDWRLQVGLVLGDIVHNLRSALEYLFWALSCHYLGIHTTERLGNQVQLPIRTTATCSGTSECISIKFRRLNGSHRQRAALPRSALSE